MERRSPWSRVRQGGWELKEEWTCERARAVLVEWSSVPRTRGGGRSEEEGEEEVLARTAASSQIRETP